VGRSPNAVPVVRDPDVARRDPELAVLSAMAHGKDEPDIAFSIASAAFAGCRQLDDERAMLYFDLIETSLGNAARAAFKDLMAHGNYEFQGEFARTHRAAGKAESLLQFLDARGIGISDEQKARVLACTDLATLDRWIRKAATVASAQELFVD
jgi:hypothetical protein